MNNLQIVYIDSDNRINTNINDSHSNFTYEIRIRQPVNRVCMTFFSMPKSYYAINSPANTLIVETSRTITIPPGNYSFGELATELQTLLNTGGLYTYTVLANSNTAKYTITSTGSTNLVFPASSTLYKNLGFDYASTNVINLSLTSTNVINLNNLPAIYVMSDIVHSDGLGQNILSVVPIYNQPDYSNIVYTNQGPDKFGRVANTTTGTTFRFTLMDLDSNIINLQNAGAVNMELLFWQESNYQALAETLIKDELLSRIKALEDKASDTQRPGGA